MYDDVMVGAIFALYGTINVWSNMCISTDSPARFLFDMESLLANPCNFVVVGS